MNKANGKPINDEQKRQLWKSIKEAHPMLAERLTKASLSKQQFVSIDGYPQTTREWLWLSIQKHNPVLADELSFLGMAKRTFGGSLSLAVDDLVTVLVEANG